MSLIKRETIIYNAKLYDFLQFQKKGYIHFGETIIKVGPMEEYETYIKSLSSEKVSILQDITQINGDKYLVLPTFVAGHTHIYSTFARGMSVPFNPKSFVDILEQLWWRLDKELDDETVSLSGLVSGMDFVKNGVTTIFDHHASGKSISEVLNVLSDSVCRDIGMRGGFCFETSDRFDVDACIKENMRFIEDNRRSCNSFGLFGLHASMTLSDDTLGKVKENLGNHPIHIHVAESKEDQEHCLQTYGKSIVKRLDDFGLLNEGSIIAHCIYISDEEAQLLAKRKCYVALNVTSNMNNSVDLPNIQLLKKHGVKCIIGNDGMTADIASEWRNLLFSMHYQTKSPTGFDLNDLREMILNSYEYANQHLACKLGQLVEGFESDLMMVAYQEPTPMNGDNALGHLIFGLSHSFKPKDVWCRGVKLVHNYELNEDRYKDILPKLDGVQEKVVDLWSRVNQE